MHQTPVVPRKLPYFFFGGGWKGKQVLKCGEYVEENVKWGKGSAKF
jgi:hypothetical protein